MNVLVLLSAKDRFRWLHNNGTAILCIQSAQQIIFMSINKNAFIRYRELDRCFQKRGRKYFIEDLLQAVNQALTEFNGMDSGINRRQLFDDIRFMESEQGWSIPLGKTRDGKKVFYHYTDPEFSITKQAITDSEKSYLEQALAILSHFSGTPQFEWLQETLPMIQEKLHIKSIGEEIIELQSNIDYQGLPFLNPLYEAIVKKQVLQISYKEFKSEAAYSLSFHPYFLKQFNNRWFVFGLNEEKSIPNWNLALDRIVEISYLSSPYITNEINWKEYFDEIVGVTKPLGGEEVVIKLEVSAEQAPYILSKPIHGTQRSKWEKDKLIVEITVIPNYELETLILSFGEKVRVLEPEWFKVKIRDRVREMLKGYDNGTVN